MSADYSIHELAIPAAPGEAGWEDFAAAMAVHFDNEALTYSTDELRLTPAEALLDFLDQDNQPTRLFVARVGDRIVGQARYELEAGDAPATVWLHIDVSPDYRQRGIGAALSAWMQSIARTDAIHKAIVYTPSRAAAGRRILAPTGYGSLPLDNVEVRFLLASGYRLEQVVRASRLALPFDAADRLAETAAVAGDDYRLHYWTNTTPTKWREEMAVLRTRMSIEEPDAGLDEPEDAWSVARLNADDARIAESTRDRLVAAVEHVPTGELIGFTALLVPGDPARAVQQSDTLVVPGHRGHRLGMLLKLANLDYLARTRPGHPSILTFNAEENRHMLDVNEAVGFVPIGYEGAWRRDLPY
ncbi:GNAT family N-acetyltransferase [Tardiphaga sp.]|uniref:GNAT family N-acetyltransferase n=1 Tax=Tardiphaga sp. TaxID=1926292 RepID=UPI00261E2EFC|nr:GNAT family N-acetyltransferase [Tardiphaga sp.]MDB5621383.1 family N-acetyltransferase [Tardiphaga sp.]